MRSQIHNKIEHETNDFYNINNINFNIFLINFLNFSVQATICLPLVRIRTQGNRDACGPLKRTLDPGPNFRVGGVSRGGWAGGSFGGGGRGGGRDPGNLQFPTTYPGSVGVREVGRNPDPEIDGPSIE